MTLAQADALAKVTGRKFSLREPAPVQTVTDRASAMRAYGAHEPAPEDDYEFRTFAALQRRDRYGK